MSRETMNILRRLIVWLMRKKLPSYTTEIYLPDKDTFIQSVKERSERYQEGYISDREEGIASDDSSVADEMNEEEE